MHSQIVVNPRFYGGTKIGKGGPVLAAKIGPGGPVLMGDQFFRYRPHKINYQFLIPSSLIHLSSKFQCGRAGRLYFFITCL